MARYYADYRLISLYLTPDGAMPSDAEYIPVGYGLVCEVLESLLASRASVLGTEVATFVRHYTEMLRRYIVGESEIVELCRRIYQKHQRALDLIFEYRPDRQATVRDVVAGLVAETSSLVRDASAKNYVRFLPQEWDALSALHGGSGWSPSGRLLLFECQNAPDSLRLRLIIGPGPQEVRQRLFEFAVNHQPPFRTTYKRLYPLWNTIYGAYCSHPKHTRRQTTSSAMPFARRGMALCATTCLS